MSKYVVVRGVRVFGTYLDGKLITTHDCCTKNDVQAVYIKEVLANIHRRDKDATVEEKVDESITKTSQFPSKLTKPKQKVEPEKDAVQDNKPKRTVRKTKG